MARSASESRGSPSRPARRSNSSATSWRSCGVMDSSSSWHGLLPCGGAYGKPAARREWVFRSKKRAGGRAISAGTHSGEVDSPLCQHAGEVAAGEKSVFLLARRRHRVEAQQFGVDPAGVAHQHAAVGQAVEKRRESLGERALQAEIIGAGKGRVAANAEPRGAATESPAQDVEQQALGVAEAAGKRAGPAALAHPGMGRVRIYRREHGLSDLRKDMHV